MIDGGGPVLVLTRQLAQHVLGAGVGRINFEFLFEFVPGFIAGGGGLGRREQQTPQAVMDADQVRILLQHLVILHRRILPVALRFESLSIQFMHLI